MGFAYANHSHVVVSEHDQYVLLQDVQVSMKYVIKEIFHSIEYGERKQMSEMFKLSQQKQNSRKKEKIKGILQKIKVFLWNSKDHKTVTTTRAESYSFCTFIQ